jgi:hypothetical protein
MMRAHAPLFSALMLLGVPLWAQAAAEVSFGPSEKFSDVRDVRNVQADVEAPLAKLLQTLADKHLPGQTLVIDVSDIDLAGEVEPVGPRMEMIRVMRSYTWPRIALHYSLKDAKGQELRAGDAKISDMDYQNSISGFASTGALRYESDMLTRWFSREFVGSPR